MNLMDFGFRSDDMSKKHSSFPYADTPTRPDADTFPLARPDADTFPLARRYSDTFFIWLAIGLLGAGRWLGDRSSRGCTANPFR